MDAIQKKDKSGNVGAIVTKGGKQVEERVTKAVYTFVEPEGAVENVKQIEEWLDANPEHLKIEVFDKTGKIHEFTKANVGTLRSVLGVP